MELSSPNAKPDAASPENALQKFNADSNLKRLEDLLAEFNLFDFLDIARSELRHSRVIAWLLNPRESHGLGAYFLRGFLSQAVVSAIEREIKCVSFTPADVDGWKFTNVEVARERHNIDILLIDGSNGFVCPIENKVGSDERSDQLSRYLDTVEREYKGLTPFPIYLTPDGRKPAKRRDAERWTPFGYEVVADLLKQTLDQCGLTISADVSSFLKQYERTIRRRVLDTPSDIDRLALQIYNDHRQAIDLIIKAKSSQTDVYWSIVEPAIAQYAPDLKHDDSSKKDMRRLFVPHLDNILPSIKEGKYWTHSGRMILFEFKYMGNMEIWLTVGPGSEGTRKRLHQLAEGVGKPFKTSRSKRMGDWFYIYRKPILNRQDFKPFDPDKARPKIEKAVAEFFDNDYWPLVNAIREEFGLPPVSPN